MASGLLADTPATKPVRKAGGRHVVPPKMSFIANDRIKLGVDLALGGAITHLSPADDESKNLINSYDLGRQVQMSYYAGPVPYTVAGHQGPPDAWKHIGWNPIQVGDCYGNPAKIIEHRNDGKTLYIKCLPMQWALDDVPGECTFECWIELEGPAVRVRGRVNMSRADKTQWPARNQELPAVYTNGKWHRLFTYAGDKPFTDGELKFVEHPFTMQSPWAHWHATERWAALVDDSNWGLGVWSPETTRFSGGFSGKKGTGGPKDAPTGYIAPMRQEVLDHNAVHEYRYALVVGDLKAIRTWVYAQPTRPTPPAWTFDKDRAGWTFHDASDAGWPIAGKLDLRLNGPDPRLISPPTAWSADDSADLEVDAAFGGKIRALQVYWATADAPNFGADRQMTFPIKAGGTRATHRFALKHEAYRGLITQLRVDTVGGENGDSFSVHAIRMIPKTPK
ncbi:hypothetical protein [Humisphaera borealis]|uniref:Uncharacterized protein n=1 Tax=Humisphaera borealis TaxID=2807512 RepID=A0A7M2X0F4_9BACT|nr:hypothetical protein [Humisphaera borealis]QOV91257.1 hypothetical protein IPV69_07830 [Humisphaera borealis]